MEPDIHDERYPQIAANERMLTKHGDPVRPVTSEEEVVIAAKSVVSTVPLPERKVKTIKTKKELRTSEIKQSSIATLSAEDIHETDF